tara:strand:+ start:7342 stop:7788 length:447 start_codon:yes stop_codon:yes gene_type:complete
MILISHRGNINKQQPQFENDPWYIDDALSMGYDVEIDIRYESGLFLGHDSGQYKIKEKWLMDRSEKLWIHCKELKALSWFNKNYKEEFNYFWHEKDTATLTSKNYLWIYPGKQPVENSIAVLPEINNDIVDQCLGVCSDIIEKYKFDK